ncbi:hypothetical protein SALBM217S_08324 [Streptomyces griseoloalbus]
MRWSGTSTKTGGSQPAHTVVGSRLATWTMIRPDPERRAMPMAYARARSLDVDPSKPTTTPCRKAGSHA